MPDASAAKLPTCLTCLTCPVCQEPVCLESAKTDEVGCAIHEDCYWARLKRNATPATQDRATRSASGNRRTTPAVGL
jgi:hypothetical protein